MGPPRPRVRAPWNSFLKKQTDGFSVFPPARIYSYVRHIGIGFAAWARYAWGQWGELVT